MAAYDHRMEEHIDDSTLATMMSDFRMDQRGHKPENHNGTVGSGDVKHVLDEFMDELNELTAEESDRLVYVNTETEEET